MVCIMVFKLRRLNAFFMSIIDHESKRWLPWQCERSLVSQLLGSAAWETAKRTYDVTRTCLNDSSCVINRNDDDDDDEDDGDGNDDDVQLVPSASRQELQHEHWPTLLTCWGRCRVALVDCAVDLHVTGSGTVHSNFWRSVVVIFRSTLGQSRPNKASLKCLSIRMYLCVRTSVRPSVHTKLRRFQCNLACR